MLVAMDAELTPPGERVCVECGRRDVWDDDAGSWVIDAQGDDRLAGDPYCIHVWDINGRHNPIKEPGQ